MPGKQISVIISFETDPPMSVEFLERFEDRMAQTEMDIRDEVTEASRGVCWVKNIDIDVVTGG